MITQDRLKEICTYDPDTGIFEGIVHRGKKYKAGDPFGKPDKKGYLQATIDGRTYRVHRLAWLYVHGVHPSVEIDHKNCITHDNRIENLRLADKSQNAWNRRGRPNKELPKHVRYDKNNKLYVVMIYSRGKVEFYSSFRNIDDAIESASRERARIHGEFQRS